MSEKIYTNSHPDNALLERGKAFLQKIYDDLDKRGTKKFGE